MKKTWKPVVAGILAIIAGIWGMVSGAIIIGGGSFYSASMFGLGMYPFMAGAIIGWGVAQIVFGIIAIVGGNHARKRGSWGWALAGSIMAIPIMPPLGILGVVFLAMGKDEFTR